jgi:RIO kinase 1
MLVQSEMRAEEEEELEAAVEPVPAELADLDRGERENKAMQEDSIFMQSYIPTSLNDLANPHAEMARLVNGQRERGYAEAVSRMLGKDVATERGDDSREAEDDSSEASGDESDPKDDDGDGSISSSSDEDDDASIDGDHIEEYCDKKDRRREARATRYATVYARTLPSKDDPEARAAEKLLRKAKNKAVKEAAALRRTTKVPKHIKKRACAQGKKKKS